MPFGASVQTLCHGLSRARPALDVIAERCSASTADANEARDWRIYAELAQRLIAQARKLYADEDLGLDLKNSVYALDSTTIDLCLSVFPWAHFRTTKSAVKMHTRLDLRGNIPSFIHISDGKLPILLARLRHDVHALDLLVPEPGAIDVMDRAYVDFSRLHVLHQAGAFFVTRAKSNMDARRVYSAPSDRAAGIICDQTIALSGVQTSLHYPEHLRRVRFNDPKTGKTLVFLTNQRTLPAATICALYKSRRAPRASGTTASRAVLQVDQAASAHQEVLRHIRERGENADLDRRLGLRAGRHRQKATRSGRVPLHFATDPLGNAVRENAHSTGSVARSVHIRRSGGRQPVESVHELAGH